MSKTETADDGLLRRTATLRELIARVEAAQGASARLDQEIARVALGWAERNGHWNIPGGAKPWGYSWLDVPRFTASLDAALTLAGDWVISSLGDMVADGLPGAVLLLSTDPVRHALGIGYGTMESGCLARALCAAALRARLAMLESKV